MYKNFKISVVAPVYNEEGSIGKFIGQVTRILEQQIKDYEIIIVDDGSTDETLNICKSIVDQHEHVSVIAFPRNYGHEIALTAGIENATGDYVIQMDSDLQHPPELIPDLIAKAQEGYDVVYAARTSRTGEPLLKRLISPVFYWFARKMTGFDIPNDTTNYRLVSRKVVDSIAGLKESNRHLLMLYAYLGYKTSSVPFATSVRHAGKSKYNYRKLCNLALDSIISFSHRPLRYMSMISVLISIVMVCYAGFILLQKLFTHQNLAAGVSSVIFIISGLFAILFLFLAIISEYIGRILVESKNRPLYYISEQYDNENNKKRSCN